MLIELTEVTALIVDGLQKVVLFVALVDQSILHPVVDLDQVVRVHAGVFDHFWHLMDKQNEISANQK